MEIISKVINLLNYTADWFSRYIIPGLGSFLRALGDLIIKILEFFVDVIRWIVSYL